MDENMSRAISMFGAALLFVVALSCAIYAYSGLIDRADVFFTLQSISGRREDAVNTFVDVDDVKREASVAEVYMAILDLPRYISTEGNSGVSEIHVDSAVYTAEVDLELGIETIKLSSPTINEEYAYGVAAALEDSDYSELMLDLLQDFCTVTDLNHTGTDSNEVLRNQEAVKTTTFSIQYDKDKIMYIKN